MPMMPEPIDFQTSSGRCSRPFVPTDYSRPGQTPEPDQSWDAIKIKFHQCK